MKINRLCPRSIEITLSNGMTLLPERTANPTGYWLLAIGFHERKPEHFSDNLQ